MRDANASAWREMRALSHIASAYWWAPPVLVALGLCVALADGVSVSLVVLFLYTVVGKGAEAVQSGGIVAHVFRWARWISGESSLGLGVLIFVVVLAKTAFNMAYSLVTTYVKNRVAEDVRLRIHQQYLSVSYDYIQRHEYTDMLNVLAKESWSIPEAYYVATRIAINLCGIAVFAVFLLAISWPLTLIALVGSTCVFILTQRFAKPLRRMYERGVALNNELGHRMLTTLQGMRTIRAFAQEAYDRSRFFAASIAVRQSFVRMGRVQTFVGPIGDVGHLTVLGAIAVAAGPLGISASVALATIALLYRLNPQISELQGNWLSLSTMDPSLRQVRGVIEMGDKSYLPEGTLPFAGLTQEIRFENVSFTYAGAQRPSLSGVSFVIPAGRTVAIVGPSGSGKTTVVNLLLRLHRANSGEISVDGVPLFDLQREAWLKGLAVAGQDVDLIDGTIRENITIGRSESGPDSLRRAAEAAGIFTFIEQTSESFDTWIGERGLNLSGGQRQRLGLARALFAMPPILILDEATSALDGSLEADIRRNVGQSHAGETLIVITHRLETVLSVDHVICIEDGRISEQGEPGALLRRADSVFKKMLDRGYASAA